MTPDELTEMPTSRRRASPVALRVVALPAVARLLGDTKDFRFLEEEKKGFFSRLFGS